MNEKKEISNQLDLAKENKRLVRELKKRNIRLSYQDQTISSLENSLISLVEENEILQKKYDNATKLPIQEEKAQEASPVVSSDEPAKKEQPSETIKE